MGWTYADTLATPLAAFEPAIAGRIQYLRASSPFGGGEKQHDEQPTKQRWQDIRAALHGAARG